MLLHDSSQVTVFFRMNRLHYTQSILCNLIGYD